MGGCDWVLLEGGGWGGVGKMVKPRAHSNFY